MILGRPPLTGRSSQKDKIRLMRQRLHMGGGERQTAEIFALINNSSYMLKKVN